MTQVANFAAGVVDAVGKFATGIVDTAWCRTLIWEYLREFCEKFEMTLMLFSGAWEKMWKNLKQNI